MLFLPSIFLRPCALGLAVLFPWATTLAAEDPAPPTIVPADLFAAPEGLEFTVWARTPLLHNPTNIDFDKDGRLWVAEGVNYRSHFQRRPGGDRIVILDDSDGDGQADKSDVFVQENGFTAPLGVAVLDNRVIVSQPPDLLVYTDVNGDRKFESNIDTREVLLTGFNGKNHDHSLHSLTAGPDGQWYWNMGNTGAVFTDKSGQTFRIGSPYDPNNGRKIPERPQIFDPTEIAGQKSDDGRVWIGGFSARMNPDGAHVQIIGHNYRNSFEQAVTSLGDLFQSDNDDPPACRVSHVLEFGNAGFASADGQRSWGADKRPGQEVPVAEWRQEDPGTMPAGDVYGGGSPTGVAFYENGALGEQWNGLLLACEAGRNVVFGYLPKPDGAGFRLERFDFLTSNQEKNFAGSDFLGGATSVKKSEIKTLFRPSDVAVGPDGALYVADWFDPRVGGHADLDDTTSGTIYRIAPKGFQSKVPKLDLATTAGQIAALKSPAVNVRHSGFTRLQAQGEKAVPAVAALLNDPNPFIAARAIWLLAQMGPVGVAQVQPLLAAKDDTMRLVAYRALRRAPQDVRGLAARFVTDPSAAIRREIALSLRDVSFEKSAAFLAALALQFDGQDRTYLEAFGTGCEGKEAAVYDILRESLGGPAEEWSEAFAWLAWRLHVPAAVADLKTRALTPSVPAAQRKLALTTLAFVNSAEAATAMVDLAATKDFAFPEDPKWWLRNRMGNLWEHYGVGEAMEARGLGNPEKANLTSVTMPEPAPVVAPLPPLAELVKIAGDATRGQAAVAVCYSCHRIGNQGIDYGPNLTTFGKQQPREVLFKAIATPSADISHGFDGSRVETTDGLIIDGIVQSKRNPVTVKSMGGVTQQVWRKRVQSVTQLGRSLMFTPETMGLTAESIADIVAYLQSDLIP